MMSVQQLKHENSINEAFLFGLPPRTKETDLLCIEEPDKRWQELITKEDMTDHFVIYCTSMVPAGSSRAVSIITVVSNLKDLPKQGLALETLNPLNP